jgi:phosphoglucosamine mutase
MKRVYFGTDGVRGPFGGPMINENFAARLGFAAARWAAESGGAGETVLIGRDTRASGPLLERALADGLRAGGLRPVSLGVLPTPAVARAVATRGARLGVVITASHNPAADNGIKFFARGGLKLSDAEEAAIEARLPAVAPDRSDATEAGADASESLTNTDQTAHDAASDYITALTALLPAGALAGWRIVADTAHGATCATTPAALRGLGADVHLIGGSPDGTNINANVGSEHPELLAREVVARGARLGVAHDGDGDRCILCDETGTVLDGDEILTILALDALRRGELAADTLVVTVQSNLGLDAAVRAAGGRVERTDVGDRYVLERLRALGARLGGESSGHIINLAHSPTGDGLAAALGVLAIMHATGRPLSALRTVLSKFPQGTRNLRVTAKRPLAECAALSAELSALEHEFDGNGRAMARFSGTEPKLRLLAEAPDADRVGAALDRLETAARRDLVIG